MCVASAPCSLLFFFVSGTVYRHCISSTNANAPIASTSTGGDEFRMWVTNEENFCLTTGGCGTTDPASCTAGCTTWPYASCYDIPASVTSAQDPNGDGNYAVSVTLVCYNSAFTCDFSYQLSLEASCGDGVCDSRISEDCSTCPGDCGLCAECVQSCTGSCDGLDFVCCLSGCGTGASPCATAIDLGTHWCCDAQSGCSPGGSTGGSTGGTSGGSTGGSTGGTPLCGDSVCSSTEDCGNCPLDCPNCCGDGACLGAETCDTGEDCVSCATDCCATCGDGVCDASELCDSVGVCEADCGSCCGGGGGGGVGWFAVDQSVLLQDGSVKSVGELRVGDLVEAGGEWTEVRDVSR